MPIKRALIWVGIWVTVAMGFAAGLWHYKGSVAGGEFLTCYIIEWSLSLDNLFVFIMIFNAFGVDSHNQLRALTWGIIGAVVMRLGFILIGVTLVEMFRPILYVFGALLLYSAVKMMFQKESDEDIMQSRLIKLIRSKISITKDFHGDKFAIKKMGRWIWTPMILVLIAIESSDVMFAIDSIPAAFAITQDPFIIFTANMFAIMGLRALYFLLVHADKMFEKLKYGIGIILAFVGVKIIVEQLGVHINILLSLSIILGCLTISILISLMTMKKGSA
ncbi:MAG: TerC/Alx family metal homeostasis membrane protein [Calditrichaeota bacterium]|jgi:tellurite resistance protein TerC|nr:TerC/Alx family metal homeostasis membrane protein [Calditrichota bacterium]MBT7617340.1 TerC/Alx family metal homeostasis membrane protein [Calditrichota bacterium]MBT7788380.1 TerC/Alx family metal homeostasis membrane protein [Calditrichota bacterium]